MKRILIIEDEYEFIEESFDYLNDIEFNRQLQFRIVKKSQEISPFSSIKDYDCVFIDLKLGQDSKMDGYAILRRIESDKLPVKKIVLLTGNNKIKEILPTRNVKGNYPVVTKPIELPVLRNVLGEIMSN